MTTLADVFGLQSEASESEAHQTMLADREPKRGRKPTKSGTKPMNTRSKTGLAPLESHAASVSHFQEATHCAGTSRIGDPALEAETSESGFAGFQSGTFTSTIQRYQQIDPGTAAVIRALEDPETKQEMLDQIRRNMSEYMAEPTELRPAAADRINFPVERFRQMMEAVTPLEGDWRDWQEDLVVQQYIKLLLDQEADINSGLASARGEDPSTSRILVSRP